MGMSAAVRTIRSVFSDREFWLRISAIALLSLFWISIIVPSAGAVAAVESERRQQAAQERIANRSNPHIKEYDGDTSANQESFTPPSGLKEQPAENKPAADYTPDTTQSAGMFGSLPEAGEETSYSQEGLTEATDPDAQQYTEEELVDQRTATSSTYRNEDGSFTTKRFNTPKFFKNEGKWKTIDTSLVEDKNAGDSGNVAGRAWGNMQSWFGGTRTYTVKANDWQARFAPSDAAQGMVRIQQGNSKVGFSPAGAATVMPEVFERDGQEIVRYAELWPGVDVEYEVKSAALKENIIIKHKDAKADFAFTISGADLKKTAPKDGEASYLYEIEGALGNDFAIAPMSISLNKYGFEANQPIKQSYGSDNKLRVAVDRGYLKGLPDDAYPVTLDPTTVKQSSFGTRSGGDFMSFKSDGYECDSTICNPMAGSVQDSGGVWRNWRAVMFADYGFLKGRQLTNATLHLTQRQGLSNSGTTATKQFRAYRAPVGCLSYTCAGTGVGPVSIGASGNINVTAIYQEQMNAGRWEEWLKVTGEETTSTTYKNWDPDNSYVTFTYTDIIPAPSVVTPTDGQVFVDPQVSFTTTTHTNANTGTPLQYVFCVSTSPSCVGAVMVSEPQTSKQWTIPDGMLQDGNTYYITMQGYDPVANVYSSQGTSVSFKIDSRSGKDSTQAYDTLGPVSADLATGNVTTSANSHSSSALGGSMGISLDYNSPVRSRAGLVGKYYNNQTFNGSPALTRVDQNIDFDWSTGSPSTTTVNNDDFSVRWEGYFVAPATGNFYFGGTHDDTYKVYVDNQLHYSATSSVTSPAAYGATPISLQLGQVVPIKVELTENTGSSAASLLVKGAVSEQPVKPEWLQTGVRDVNQPYGLTGKYYKDNGTHDFSNSANTLLMERNDPLISFDWGFGPAAPGGPTDKFMVRWSGYITVPTTGTYDIGTKSDDGTRIKIGTNNTQILNEWHSNPGTPYWGTTPLIANQPTPITVEYYENTGAARMYLRIKSAGAGITEQLVPMEWLSSKAPVLPAGWNLGIDPDGGLSYNYIQITPNSAILTDSSGSTHEYKWNTAKKAYSPPVDEDGQLVKNEDGTYTLEDSDGRTYVFDTDGTVKSVTNPIDDQKPAALQYVYGGTPSKLTQIKDSVDVNRWVKVYYSGDTNCTIAPTGFDTQAPTNMLCAVETNDGRKTSFFYMNGKLARIHEPGNEVTDYQYDTLGRIIAIRDSMAADAISAGVRANDATTNTELAYDDLGRIVSVKQPAATSGGNRTEHTLKYYPGNGSTYYGATEQHVTGMTEPNGFARRVEYDSLLRTIADTDIAGLTDTTEWHATKDMVLSTTDETGMKSTTIYDDEDREVTEYGPAPAAWYDTNRAPLSTYAAQVPRTDTNYDEGMMGPSVAYYAYSGVSKTLTGAPKLHSTNLIGAAPNQASVNWGSTSPVPGTATNWGFRATGKIRLPATGEYKFRSYSDNGMRLYIDDTLILDDWSDGSARWHPEEELFSNVAGSVHRFRLEYYHTTGNARFEIHVTPPGGASTANINPFISPGYNLETSSKTYDSTLGDSVTTTNYGSNPELGLVQSASTDPTGLNLTTSNTYETAGATGSFLRQTSKVLPGNTTANPTFAYTYYGATETRDDPCTTGTTEAYRQGGMLKIKTEADPDGVGSQSSRTSETVYDDAGRAVATRYNADSWTCTTYDSRGRVTQTAVPAYNGAPARTILNDYAVSGDPLVTSSWDGNGWIIEWSDLLGRTTKYRDVYDHETTTTYNDLGLVTSRTGPLGTEEYVYDSYLRLSQQKLDSVTYASVTYDAYGRTDYVDYNNAGQMRVTAGRDSMGRETSQTYRMGDGTTTISDAVTVTQSGQVTSSTITSGSSSVVSSYTYDGADRLTGATVGSNTYAYGFGTQDSSCGSGSNMNANAGKNSNRTSQTINSVTTYFCYDHADRLVDSSNGVYDDPTYDSHGNTTALGTLSATPMLGWIGYDSSDRNTGFEQYDQNGDGTAIYYDRDVSDRIIARYPNSISAWNWTPGNEYFYGHTADGDTPDFVRNSNWDIIEKHIQLPGGVLLTIKPQQTGNNAKSYNLPNTHDDTLLTTNAAGTNTSNGTGPQSSHLYDPFGNPVPGAVLPSNTAEASYAYVGQHQKLTESNLTLNPIQMGARVYLPGIGRFASVDPVDGGTENRYVYPADPVNYVDLNGEFAFLAPAAWMVGRMAVQQAAKYAAKKAAQKAVQQAKKRALREAKKRAAREATRRTAKKSIKSLERQASAHRKKLAQYIRNPIKYDNKGYLKNAPNDAIRRKIIQSRVNHLQQEIRNFEAQIRQWKRKL
jgi:RHS repeat-associated protein